MSKLTKGTQLYIIDPDDDSVLEITDVVSLNPGGAPADQIEVTVLTSDQKEFVRGMRTPGTASLEINADPANESHIRLHELFLDDDVETIPFIVGWSGDTTDPDVDSGGAFDISAATARTWYQFSGYVSDFPFDFSTNTVVKTAVSIQRTGENSVWTEASA